MATLRRLERSSRWALVTLAGLSPYVALPVTMMLTAAIAVALDKTFYAYLRERPKIVTVMASLGVALMLRAVVQMVWGWIPRPTHAASCGRRTGSACVCGTGRS